MYKIVFLFFLSFLAMIIAGCKEDTTDTKNPVHSDKLDIKDLAAPYQDGLLSFSILADWTTTEATRTASFTIFKISNPGCTYSENNITVSRAIPFPIDRTMTNFGSCFVPGLTYKLTVHVDGLTDASQDFDWSNEVNPATIMISIARQWKTGITISFYEPPSWFNNNAINLKNTTGSVAWTSRGLTNNLHTETKDSYICRLTDASRNNPQNWNQYICETWYCFNSIRSGIPFPNPFTPDLNAFYDEECNCGFVCYSFVYAVAKAAGYSLFTEEPTAVSYFTSFIEKTQSERKIGDVVLFNFDKIGEYDHVAIITQKSSIKIEDDMVISTMSQHDIFKDGVAEIRLGGFHTVSNGGVFPNDGKWISLWDTWTTSSNIKIFRLQ